MTSPATFSRTSNDQNVAFSSGRTLSYHTPLPRVDNAMVDSHSSVAYSIPASRPPPCTHRPPLSRWYPHASRRPKTSASTADFNMAGNIIFFCSSGVGGMVPNARISGPVKTFPHITKSEKNAPTPASSPARIQFIECPLPKECALVLAPPGYADLGHGGEIQHLLQVLALENALFDDQLPHGDVLRHRFLGELSRLRVADLRGQSRNQRRAALEPVLALRRVGLDALDAPFRECARGIGENRHREQQI